MPLIFLFIYFCTTNERKCPTLRVSQYQISYEVRTVTPAYKFYAVLLSQWIWCRFNGRAQKKSLLTPLTQNPQNHSWQRRYILHSILVNKIFNKILYFIIFVWWTFVKNKNCCRDIFLFFLSLSLFTDEPTKKNTYCVFDASLFMCSCFS